MSAPASKSMSRVPSRASNSRARFSCPASGSVPQIPTVASSSRAPALTSSSVKGIEANIPQNLPLLSSPRPFRGTIRYVCTVHPLCRQTFDNYNNWAQHETNVHNMTDVQEDAHAKNSSSSSNLNKKIKSDRGPSTQPKDAAIQKNDPLTNTYDIWYCDGLDGCTNAFYKRTDFEIHFRDEHSPGWNRIPRSTNSNDYLLGPEHGVRLWCGFCNMVMEVSSKEKWHYDRLQHVASHFDRTCADEVWYGDIYGWVFLEVR